MSGHSKWSQIKRQKGVADVRRGATFTKIANAISIATKEGGGGDPASNFKLRLVMDQARSVNMPKENIQRAIDRGLGKGGGASLETVSYEGYGPGKVAVIVEAATDNKNRTTPEVRSMMEKLGGTFASQGAVSWMFADSGLIVCARDGKTIDEFLDVAAEAGAEDVEESEEGFEVYTKPSELEKVKQELVSKGVEVKSSELIKKPTTTVTLGDKETAKKVLDFMDKIEDMDDVQKVWSNFEISDTLIGE